MTAYFVVFLGGGLGAALRYFVTNLAIRWLGPELPWGTIIVNVSGSLIMGLLAGWFAYHTDSHQTLKIFLTTGILGGFTTFSTFSLDVATVYEKGDVMVAVVYIAISVFISIAMAVVGLALMRS
jgi:CrcB protein